MTQTIPHPTHTASRHLLTTYLIEGILSFATSLIFIGIFFYTTNVFGWGLIGNFSLATAQGVIYIAASLMTGRISRALGPRRLLFVSNAALAAVSAASILFSANPIVLSALVLLYVPLAGLNWPVLEAAASANADPHQLSRRIGLYNVIWAFTGAVAVAVQGLLIKLDPRAVFAAPLLIHLAILLILWTQRKHPAPQDATHAHLQPEPQLLHRRTQALWLSRITLPSTYVVIYTLSALIPLLPAVKSLDPFAQTLVGCVWLVTRFLAFAFLGWTVFWHTRPLLLLGAGVIMAFSFIAVTIPPSSWHTPSPARANEFNSPASASRVGEGRGEGTSIAHPPRSSHDLASIILGQALLGLALGMIYTASLYFGMVLSKASTDHAGYHEALIGLGQVLGPGVGALTQARWPEQILPASLAVAAIIAASLLSASVAAAKGRSRDL